MHYKTALSNLHDYAVELVPAVLRVAGGVNRRFPLIAQPDSYRIAPNLKAAKKMALDVLIASRGDMMIPVKKEGILRRAEGLVNARNSPNIEKIEIVIREVHELIPLPKGNQYPGYIFAHGDSSNGVTTALRLAYSKLDLIVTPVFKMLHK